MRASYRPTHSKLREQSALYHAHVREALEPPRFLLAVLPFLVSPIAEAKHRA